MKQCCISSLYIYIKNTFMRQYRSYSFRRQNLAQSRTSPASKMGSGSLVDEEFEGTVIKPGKV